METLITWINQQLNDRGWSRSEAARRGGISSSMIDKVIGGFAQPGLDFCKGISRAFNVPQMALGHTTLEMVRVYLSLADTDLVSAHQHASPVENWHL